MSPVSVALRCLFLLGLTASAPLSAQLVYAAPADFGGRTGIGLFQLINGTATALPTGFPEHNFPALSRDNRFIVFSSPDGVIPALQVPPSSDIYVYDRATATTRRIVNNETIVFSPAEVDTATPTSAALSPDNQLLAYGVAITRRQGTANPRTTKELNIARASDGLILANPTAGRGPVSDAFQAEFVGLSWDPGGNSFVTPTYVNVTTQMGGTQQLPAIVRYARANDGTWSIAGVLSTPRYFDGQFPIAAEVHLYPTISPSGAGLAYIALSWPDVFGASQGVFTTVVVANADGSGARALTTFNQGFYPAGLNWSPDGTSLVLSIAQQANIGTGFLASAVLSTAVVRTISTADGSIASVPGVDAGFFPTWRSFGSAPGSLAGVRLQVGSAGANQFLLRATGVNPASTYFLQSSADLAGDTFGPAQAFTGAQLANGIALNLPTATRFFRLTDASGQ